MFLSISAAPAKPTLKELKVALKSVSDWHSLGVHLELKIHQLDTIEKNHRGDDERCKTEMLISWLNNSTIPTWEAIVQALGLIEHGRVADEIQRKYIGIFNTTTEGTVFLYMHVSCSLKLEIVVVVASMWKLTQSRKEAGVMITLHFCPLHV